jgi:hypothetical protein
MQLLIMQFSPASCHFIPRRSKSIFHTQTAWQQALNYLQFVRAQHMLDTGVALIILLSIYLFLHLLLAGIT